MPGVTISTNAANNMVWTQSQLQRWTGTMNWDCSAEY